MAVPVIKGVKTASERFAGALETYCIESLMQDGKALQSGTSHFLGQNFAKAFDVQFLTRENKMEHVWATSWGVSTRLVGALVMAHGDDQGLVLPPKLAPLQVVIVPIYKGDEQKGIIHNKVVEIKKQLIDLGISVKYDDSDNARPGWKFAQYELQGVPVRMAIGPKDLHNNTVEIARRDTREKYTVSLDGISFYIKTLLDEIQLNLFTRAKQFRDEHITEVNNWDQFKQVLEEKGGFLSAHWDGTAETEEKIKEETKATIRCIPLNNPQKKGKCVYSGAPSKERVLFAVAY
jgi:prolyl-tRNA synthetase